MECGLAHGVSAWPLTWYFSHIYEIGRQVLAHPDRAFRGRRIAFEMVSYGS